MEVRFDLGEGDFGQKGQNSFTARNHRMRADITLGGTINSEATVTIYGLSLDVMARLTVLNVLAYTDARHNNFMRIYAGDDDGVSPCFSGNIQQAWADMRSPSEGKLVAHAFGGYVNNIAPASPSSYRGSVPVATILQRICDQWSPPLRLENGGVDAQLNNPYKAGTLMDQLRSVVRDADINCFLTDDNVLAIWPKGGVRPGTAIVVSKDTGMIGYPAFTQTGVQVTTLFNPLLQFGQPVIVKSILSEAAKQWRVDHVSHNLEVESPNGVWNTEIECSQFTAPVPVKSG